MQLCEKWCQDQPSFITGISYFLFGDKFLTSRRYPFWGFKAENFFYVELRFSVMCLHERKSLADSDQTENQVVTKDETEESSINKTAN